MSSEKVLDDLKTFRESFVIAVGDKSPFAKESLKVFDKALAEIEKPSPAVALPDDFDKYISQNSPKLSILSRLREPKVVEIVEQLRNVWNDSRAALPSPRITEQDAPKHQEKLFCDWFNRKYLTSIVITDDGVSAPLLNGRSQGRSVALTACTAWAAWQESRQSAVIELPKAITLDAQFYFVALCQHLRGQGYRVEVKTENKCCKGGPHSGHEYSCHHAFEF